MKLLIAIINDPDLTADVLDEFYQNDIKGATVLESKGMAHIMAHYTPFFARFAEFGDKNDRNSTIFVVVNEDEERDLVVNCIESIVGDLSKSETGIVMTLPIDYCKGLIKQ
ncbi:hypothetical protein SAMN05421734_10777 [Pelagirhabdus alkalitolerans]|uniref:Nitrogen regulatory protein P-II family n=1 Tax=Pelagirhabdus alkalitolerans TaxID=1612202 RepID=A0A1G6L3A1_9BACI|nr:hypothetical protein [Pelagirhabdus alkalitolerans]SDC37588.1 hypothetical protein SAMN05421734_10777 [Pelagirhabdus alkalitolerans]